jgi:chloramphenicol-sensitive protein RarD
MDIKTSSASLVKPDRGGVMYAVAAFGLWGLFPLYWKALSALEPLQLLSCRILFSLVFVWLLLAAKGKPGWPRVLARPGVFFGLLVSASLIGINWGFYIWAVNSGMTVEASLGYYINPLVNIVMGLILFKERLTGLQWVAVAFSAAGVLFLTIGTGAFPWLSLLLAFSFAFYGLAKKRLKIDPLEALGGETLLLSPLALAWLAFREASGSGVIAKLLAGGLPGGSAGGALLLAFSGIATSLPLLWFAVAAGRLRLSTLGFVQFLSPTIQLLIGVLAFHESFDAGKAAGFVPVWIGLAVYVVSLLRGKRVEAERAPAASPANL